MVQRFSSCVQFWVIFRITHTEKILNHLKVIRELQCAEVAEPSLGSGGTPGIAMGIQQRGLSFVLFWEEKTGAMQIFLEKSKLPGE